VPFLTAAATTSCKPACASIERTNRWASQTTWESPSPRALPGEHKLMLRLGRWIPPTKLKKKKCTIIKHGQQKGWVEHWTYPGERGQDKKITTQRWTLSKQTQQYATSKVGRVVDRRADLLNQRAAFKLELPHLAGGGAEQTAAAEG
jgi:hypothetical protein